MLSHLDPEKEYLWMRLRTRLKRVLLNFEDFCEITLWGKAKEKMYLLNELPKADALKCLVLSNQQPEKYSETKKNRTEQLGNHESRIKIADK